VQNTQLATVRLSVDMSRQAGCAFLPAMLLRRHDKIVAHFEARAKELGEGAVFAP